MPTISREERWKALTDANAAVEAAVEEWSTDPTPQTRVAADEAAREYVRCLAFLIDLQLAQRLAICLRAFRESGDRVDSLRATLIAKPAVDATDAELLSQLVEENAKAQRVYEAAGAAVIVAVDQARAADSQEA